MYLSIQVHLFENKISYNIRIYVNKYTYLKSKE